MYVDAVLRLFTPLSNLCRRVQTPSLLTLLTFGLGKSLDRWSTWSLPPITFAHYPYTRIQTNKPDLNVFEAGDVILVLSRETCHAGS